MHGDGLQRLARAMALLREHRLSGAPDARLLAEHPDLRELLEPLLAEPEGGGARPADPGVLGDFRLLRTIGRGGMGEVFEAVQRSLGRRVALKVLPLERAASPAALARFRREAELLANVRHAHVVAVFATGEAEGRHFFAMELVEGATLAQLVERVKAAGATAASCDGSTLAAALRAELGDATAGERLVARDHAAAVFGCLLPIAEALAHVHGHGIVHRDVKPSNILLRADGQPLLTDFGLARGADGPGVTQTGDLAGTPHYVAPEQIAGGTKEADHRTDVFALGVTLYELLTLQRPFEATSTEAVLQRVLRAAPADPASSGAPLSADVLAVLDKALQKHPADRYPDMAAFAADLRALRDQRQVSVRRPGPLTRLRRYARREPLRAGFVAVLALLLPAVLGLGLYLLVQQPRISAAAARERELHVEELLEGGYLELGDGNPHVAVRRFLLADGLEPGRPEVLVGLVLAFDRLGRGEQMRQARDRLGVTHPQLQQELLGMASDVDHATAAARAVEPTPGPAPTDALGCYVRGMRWLAYAHGSGHASAYERAAEALRDCIARAPVARALYHCQYLHALAHLGAAAPIRTWCDVVAHLWPTAPIATFWRGFALEDVDSERAAALLRRVVAERDDLTLPRCALARTHETAARWREALELYRGVLAEWADDPVALCGAARSLLHLGDANAALPLATRVRALAPQYSIAHATFAAVLLELGRADEALVAVDQAVALMASDPESQLLRCRVLHALGRHAEALAAATTAEALLPGDAEPFVLAAIVHESAGDIAAARDAIRRVTELQPERADAWSQLGWHSLTLREVDAARGAFERALALQPDSATAHGALGLWHKRHGERHTAATLLRRALELDPGAQPARVNLASLSWELGDRDGALALYREAATSAPDLESASDGLAWVLARLGRHGEAIAERRRWAEAHPDARLGWLRLCNGCLDAPDDDALELAATALDRATAASAGPRADLLFWRASLLQRRGAPAAEVRALYEQALAAPFCSDELASSVRARLAELR